MTRRRRRTMPHAVLGLAMAVVALVALAVSYTADERLPFRPTYELSADVPDAAQLRAGDPVRIGGARVGIVRDVTAHRGARGPYARIAVAIYGRRRVPADSTVSVRPLSILGAKALQIEPGRSARLLPGGATLPLSHARATVDIPDALSVFDPRTRRALRGTVQGFGTSFAGRGVQLNEAIRGTSTLLDPLRRVADNLADPRTRLGGLIVAADDLMRALEPVSGDLPVLIADTATTFGALADAQPHFGDLIDRLPATERATTATLRQARPVLADLSGLARDLRTAGPLLEPAARGLHPVLTAAVPAARELRAGAPELGRVAAALRAVVPPRSERLSRSLIGLDATVRHVHRLLAVAGPAQLSCNALAVALRNGASVIGEGDQDGSWFTFIPVITPFLTPQAADTDDTHRNPHPIEDGRGCTAGNTPYVAGRQTGNPAQLTHAFEPSSAPAEARARAAGAGLLTPAPGARLR